MNPYESKEHEYWPTIQFFESANQFIRWVIILSLALYGLISLLHDTKILVEDKDGYPHFFFEEDLQKYIRKII